MPCRAVPCHAGELPGTGGGGGGQKGVSLKLKHFIPIGGLGTCQHGQGKSTRKTKTSYCSHGARGWLGGGGKLAKSPLSLARSPWQPARPFLT